MHKTPLAVSKAFIGIAFIFAIVPLGFRTSTLSLMAIGGLAWLNYTGHIRGSPPLLFWAFLGAAGMGTIYSVSQGEPWVFFQLLRGLVFPLSLIWILTAQINRCFFQALDKAVPLIETCAIVSAILYFAIGSDLYNSTLDIPYEDAQYKRLFVYPTYFFLSLLFMAIRSGAKRQVTYVLLLAASGSKAIFLSIAFLYASLLLAHLSWRRLMVGVTALGLLITASLLGGLHHRLADFASDGDPWRYYEPLAAVERLSDPVRAIIGNGAGVPYWGGRDSLVEELINNTDRVIVNSYFDVHNGFLTIALRFGIPLMVVYFIILARAIPSTAGGNAFRAAVLMNVFLSHGPVQMVEAVGLGLGLRYLKFHSEDARGLA